MAYIGAEPLPGQNREVDDISGSFNGSTTAFTLQVNGLNVSPETANNILVNIGGVIQNPGTDYTIAASTITFTTAPASGLSFFAIILGAGINTATVADDTIGASKLIDTAVTAGSYTTADITVDAQGRITAAASGTIANAEIADNAVTTAKIADSTGASDGVTTAKLATDAVTAAKLASNSVVSDSIVDGSIVNADVNASAAIARTKLANVDVVDDSSPQLGGDLASNGNDILIADDDRIKFGTGNDLHIYHNQSNSVIREEGTGNLNIQTTGGNVEILTNTTENSAKFISNGAVELYNDNSLRANTESYGFKILNTNDSGATTLKLENNSTANNQVPRFDIAVDLASGKNGGSVQFVRANNYQSSAAADSEIVISPAKNDSNLEIVRITQDYVRLNSNSSGIQFNSDTAAANALNDYEEGTWTPAYNAGSSASACFAAGISYNTGGQTGFYTKIGNIVYFRLNIDASSSGLVAKSGILQINSLPYTAVSQSHVNSGAAFYQFTSAFGTGSANRPTPVVIQGNTIIQFYNQNGTAFAGTDLSGPQQPIQLAGFYEAA